MSKESIKKDIDRGAALYMETNNPQDIEKLNTIMDKLYKLYNKYC